jgi:hypothetical protein
MSVITGYGNLNSLQDSLTSLLCDVRDLRAGKLPRSIDLNTAPIVDKWSYGLVPARCLVGSVSGHPILGNLAGIHTSELVLIDPGRGWARTWGRYYRLGEPAGAATGSESL